MRPMLGRAASPRLHGTAAAALGSSQLRCEASQCEAFRAPFNHSWQMLVGLRANFIVDASTKIGTPRGTFSTLRA